ncbi:MAG: hypothetical protein L3J54_08935 [Draconibacterium sp.]|nr:hypothetical protein [Draconibacterium sp.]
MKRVVLLVFAATLLLSCSKETGDEIVDVEDLSPPKTDKPLTSEVVVFTDVFEGKKIVLAGNAKDLFIVSFERELDTISRF